MGVFTCLTRGVGGSDLTVTGAFGAEDLVGGVALAATRGVNGGRAERFGASVGFSGRLVLLGRSAVDIAALPPKRSATLLSLPQSCSIVACSSRTQCSIFARRFFPCAVNIAFSDPSTRANTSVALYLRRVTVLLSERDSRMIAMLPAMRVD